MSNIDFQGIDHINNRNVALESRNPAEGTRTDEQEIRTDAPNVVINNMAQINIQHIVYSDRSSYNNGHFIPVFQDAIRAIACNRYVKPGTRRVLDYILGTVDENNCFYEELTDIANNLSCSEDTVERALKQLVAMHIICKKEGARDRSLYELSDKILNPRFAFKGNTRKLRKDDMPVLLDPGAAAPLIPSLFDTLDF